MVFNVCVFHKRIKSFQVNIRKTNYSSHISLSVKKYRFHLQRIVHFGMISNSNPMYKYTWENFTVNHALPCVKEGFPIIRHKKIRDLTALLFSSV